jgi:hypothetical protein
MNKTVSQIQSELADREAIRDCLYRYCRGIDRMDAELLRSAYWPGAMDYHTGFTGTVEQFVQWALPRLQAMQDSVHNLGNILIKLDGDKAAVESYFWSVAIVPGDEPRQVMACGRYLDRFEKRNDEWRIAERVVAHDWFQESTQLGDWSIGPFGIPGLLRGRADAEDKSYTWLGLR